MKKIMVMLIGVCFVFTGADAFAKKAKKKKKGKKEKKEVTVAPQSDQIAPMIEEYKWGMSSDEVLKVINGKIQKEFQEKMGKANDPIKEDKLHQDMLKKIKEVKKSYIEYTGQVTGYDSSLVKTEYTHNNSESMLLFTKDMKGDRKWDDYFFFINGKLWKIFRAFDAEMFPGLTWKDVQSAMESKFGSGPFKLKHFDPDTKIVSTLGVQWQNKDTMLTLLNYTSFYGIFCLRFEEKAVLEQIDSLRVNKPMEKTGPSVVDAITEGSATDGSSDIVDQLTKKKPKSKGSSGSSGSSGSPKSSGSSGSVPPPKEKDESSILDDI